MYFKSEDILGCSLKQIQPKIISKVIKSALRKIYLEKRKNLSKEDFAQQNAQIQKLSFQLLEKLQPKFVHIFLSQRNTNEIDTAPLIGQINQNLPHIAIVSPYIIPGTKNLKHYLLSDKLIENKWGIPEPDPTQSELILPEKLDIVFLPLLIFDQKGYRVGYGGGFYDRFLAECKPNVVKIGVSIFEAIESIEDINAYDIPMDLCITPNQVWDWRLINTL